MILESIGQLAALRAALATLVGAVSRRIPSKLEAAAADVRAAEGVSSALQASFDR